MTSFSPELHLYRSNRLEHLAEHLTALVSVPLPDPFAPETVVVQNLGMARWLEQQLAERRGIAANIDFPLPARFFWRMFACWFPELAQDQGWSRDELTWRLYAVLPSLLPDAAFAELRGYLGEEIDEGKRYQLCRRIADLFDQYPVYRPEMVLAWDAGQEEHWQARLWRTVTAGVAAPHRAALWQRFHRAMQDGEQPVQSLPSRAVFFGLTALAPAYMELLRGLAGFMDIHLLLCAPSREYWGDVVTERSLAKRVSSAGEGAAALLDVGNPLLASMGHAGRDLLDMILACDPHDDEDFQAPPDDGRLLHQVQHDILALHDRRGADQRTPLAPDDQSLQVHSCHSPLREVQVLHDRLLLLFEQLPGLAPRDIVVMAPEIETYAPWIEAVFSSVPEDHHIPWTIADRRAPASRPLIAAALGLLGLPDSRLEAPPLLDLLEMAPVRRRFGLDQADLPRLRQWVRDSNIRWGADGAHRAACDLPAAEENTWEFGLDRLFLGYALPPGQEFCLGLAPCFGAEGSDAVGLGTLAEFFFRLRQWRETLEQPLVPADWPGRLQHLLDAFFLPDIDDEEEQLQELRDAMSRLATDCGRAGSVEALSATLVAQCLEELLSGHEAAHGYLGGRLTCCNMVPMRSLPFRVICLLGLNDTDFPRRQRPSGFDLMAQKPRKGDRSRRADDRYLFLEALISARAVLYLSYVGRDIRDDSTREPSVLLSELLDYICHAWRLPDGAAGQNECTAVLQRLLIQHPLQPFSKRLFDGSDPRLFSHSRAWLQAAVPFPHQSVAFADGALAPSTEDGAHSTVTLGELLRFCTDPAGEFVSRVLGIRKPREEEALEESEPFELEGLAGYGLREELLRRVVADESTGLERTADDFLHLARARGELPHGSPGELAFQQQVDQVRSLAGRLEKYPADTRPDLTLDAVIAGVRLTGALPSRAVHGGLLGYRCGRLRAKDRLTAWITHLACTLLLEDTARSYETEPGSHGGNATFALQALRSGEAGEQLASLLELRWQGLARPLPFAPESSLAMVEKGLGDTGMAAARKAWEGNKHASGEADGFAARIVWRDDGPMGEDEFAAVAAQVWRPLLAAAGGKGQGDEA
ncbi:MAG: exodeoxyribonuclease V subunit gamma [Desulfobulbaceae bacterium A2]|nr:MAG: exodeoxyribonuclease V subunit gamma [Desulfobulbaceae bacterium A2]